MDVPPAKVALVVSDASRWRTWWPDFALTVDELRGPKGVRWFVRSARNGALAGSMEIWLEPVGTGTIAHYFLRLEGTGRTVPRRLRERLTARYRARAKRVLWEVADELDPDRLARISVSTPTAAAGVPSIETFRDSPGRRGP